MKQHIDILIKNANIIDAKQKTIKKGNIAIECNKIVEYDLNKEYIIDDELNGEGYYVSPGWIDAHTHIFYECTESGLPADVSLIPMGVTTTIDGGSCGYGNWKTFKKNIVDNSILNVIYSINVSPSGQITERYPENIDPRCYILEEYKKIMQEDSKYSRGLKLRYGTEVVEKFGNNVLDEVIELANKLGCFLTVHVTNPPCEMEEIINKMRDGDIVCHIYQGKRSTILDENNIVKKAIFKAQKRGVFFDSADARINHSYAIIRPAIEQGFKPDIISTDLTYASMFRNMCWGLPVVLSKWLNLGLSLEEVIQACTYNPAKIHHLGDGLGTLDVGAHGNVTIFKVINKEFHMKNRLNEDFIGQKLIVPQVTIINGKIVYRNVEFPF